MSLYSSASRFKARERPLLGFADFPLRLVASAARFGGNAQWLVVGGRAVLIWLPVYTLLATELPPLAAIATTSLVTGVWLLALRAALSTYYTLGPAVASAVGTATGLVAVSALDLWMPGMSVDALTLGETTLAIFLLSGVWEHVVRAVAKRRVLIVGTNGIATAVMQELACAEQAPFTVVGVVDDGDTADGRATAPLGSIPDLSAIVDAQRPDIVILTDERTSASALDRLLSRTPIDFKVVSVPHFFEHAFGRVPLGYLTPGWFMSMLHLRQKTYTRLAKRAFDLFVATLGLLLVTPLAPILIALVRTTPGPILYRQQRLGEGGRRFTMYKLRTMRKDAEDAGRALFAAERDPRATRVGHFLRRTHLDETPQLWNVLRGDMSMVGPRPERPEFVAMLEATVPFWTRRLLVKPGITGWAQLRCGYADDAESTAQKLSYDLWYLRNRNVIVDLAICAKTFSALVLGSGDRRVAR